MKTKIKINKNLHKIEINCGGINWIGYARNEHTAFRRAIKDAFPHERVFAELARFRVNGGPWMYQNPQSLEA